MFERFSKDARAAVVHAQEQARLMRSPTIEPAHLLVGLALTESTARELLDAAGHTAEQLRDRYAELPSGGALDTEALAGLGIDADQVRRRVESTFGEGALDTPHKQWRAGHIPFSALAKGSLERALHETTDRGHKTISSAHVLLGVIDADEDTLSQVVGSAEELDRLRSAAIQRLGEQAA
jgi:ATP-dependent Clp protease ATP-binding subunit ClpA